MIFSLISLFKSMYFFTGSYSINVFPEPLSADEEQIYLEKLKNGDKEARAKLIEHNLRLVAHIVNVFKMKFLCILDQIKNI